MWNLLLRTTNTPSRWVRTRHQSTMTDTLHKLRAGTTILRCLAVPAPPVRECQSSSSANLQTGSAQFSSAHGRPCGLGAFAEVFPFQLSEMCVFAQTVAYRSQRVSVYLLGDFDPDDQDDTPTLSPTACSKTPPLNTRRVQVASQRKQRRSEPSKVPTSPVQPADHQTTGGGSCGAANEPQKTSPEVQLNSMDRAVGVVLSAKRFMVRFRSSVVVPYKPDTPVPPDMQPPDIQIHRTSVKEPIRFVYEGPLPYTRNTGLQLKPTMNHLRVPGRPPPNVPQTIIEEDPVLITPPTTPPSPGTGLEPPSPSTRRRKNASSWIAPPVIDVMEVDATHAKDMRVECPGVLVEHHN